MRKIGSLLIILCVWLSGVAVAATEEPVKIVINQQYVTCDIPPRIQNGRTLVPLRPVFEALGCDVYWQGESLPIIIVKNDTKLLLWTDNVMLYQYTGTDIERFQQQILNGYGNNIIQYQLDVPPQLVADRTMVPVRTLCEVLGMTVSWDEANQTVWLTCDESILQQPNQDTQFAIQAYEFFQGVDNLDKLARQKWPWYVEGNLNILLELNLVTKEKLEKGSYITNLEALTLIHKICCPLTVVSKQPPDLKEWYRGDTLEPLDYLDDTMKAFILDLVITGTYQIVTEDEILQMNFDENITQYEALVYMTRMLSDTHGCIFYQEELDFTEKIQTYEAAYKKGIIDDIDINSADLPILRTDFYHLIHKAIFAERVEGSFVPVKRRCVDSLIRIKNGEYQTQTEPPKKVTIHTNKMTIEPVINEDLSISWILPDHIQEGYWTEFVAVTKEGEKKGHIVSGGVRTKISIEEIIKYSVHAYPAKLDHISYAYYQYDSNAVTREVYYFELDMSAVTLQIKGDELIPEIYRQYQNGWHAKSISLAEGQSFKKGAYYVLTSYEHTYRKPEYNNLIQRVVFRAWETSNILYDLYKDNRIPLALGSIDLDEIHIQEVLVEQNHNGFTLFVTPESMNSFTVVKSE